MFWGYSTKTLDHNFAHASWFPSSFHPLPKGRRVRVFAGLCNTRMFSTPEEFRYEGMPWADALAAAEADPETRAILSELPMARLLGKRYDRIPENFDSPKDAEVCEYLQDLALEITEDTQEACAALDDPDLFYPGIDEGIDPVPDEHVELVIWGMQRELDRELRSIAITYSPRPAVPLKDLPWRVQRALAERRRWRYLQFGIGNEQWKRNVFSLWDVHEDPDWLPRKVRRTHPDAAV